MPKSKVRSKSEYTDAAVSRTPVKVKGAPTARWYIGVMLGLMLLGLAWLVLYYIAGEKIPFMMALETWQNFAIGFGIAVIGLLITMIWRYSRRCCINPQHLPQVTPSNWPSGCRFS